MIRQWAESLKPLDVSDAALALDAIREVAPGGHFFGPSTRSNASSMRSTSR